MAGKWLARVMDRELTRRIPASRIKKCRIGFGPDEWDSSALRSGVSSSRETGRPTGALDRGLAILDYLATSREATVPGIAEATGLTRSTTYRLVDRLHRSGYLSSEEGNGVWRLGSSAARLAMAAVQSTDVIHAAPELVRLLVQQTRETVGLGVYSNGEMVFAYREKG